jgi:hypothetical protein
MNVSFNYDKKDDLDFCQGDMSIYSTHLNIEGKNDNVEIFMSVKDAQGFIDEFQKSLDKYRNNHYWWKDNWNK